MHWLISFNDSLRHSLVQNYQFKIPKEYKNWKDKIQNEPYLANSSQSTARGRPLKHRQSGGERSLLLFINTLNKFWESRCSALQSRWLLISSGIYDVNLLQVLIKFVWVT